jgi:hypothetical protein
MKWPPVETIGDIERSARNWHKADAMNATIATSVHLRAAAAAPAYYYAWEAGTS